mmetsp:Transcript_2248/g.5604  ORF Transcript_2248/g.5604 Transcript_2248/m.5604 type:complete len:276 (-) Transcript_2248:239-1066(-)|eukprot:jgi/Tetstr1/443023/TSEL_031083.t1
MCGTFPRDLRPQARPDLVAAADAAAFLAKQQQYTPVQQPQPVAADPVSLSKDFNLFDAASWAVLDSELEYGNVLAGCSSGVGATCAPLDALFEDPQWMVSPEFLPTVEEELPYSKTSSKTSSAETGGCFKQEADEDSQEDTHNNSEHLTEEDRIFNAARLGPLFQGAAGHEEPTAEELKTHPCFATLKSAGVRIKGRSRLELVAVAERIRKRRRESAARSRARKANKLSTLSAENNALRNENSVLRRRVQELVAAAEQRKQLPTHQGLCMQFPVM